MIQPPLRSQADAALDALPKTLEQCERLQAYVDYYRGALRQIRGLRQPGDARRVAAVALNAVIEIKGQSVFVSEPPHVG